MIDTKGIKGIYRGGDAVTAAWRGNTLLWKRKPQIQGFIISGTSTGSQITYMANGTNLTSPVTNGTFKIECDETVTRFQINRGSQDTYITSVAVMGDTSHLTTGEYMFYCMRNCKTFDLKELNTSNMTSMSAMFDQEYNATALDITGFNTSKCTSFQSMLSNAQKITTLDLSHLDTSKGTNFDDMLNGIKSCPTLDCSNFNMENATSIAHMFVWSEGVQTINLDNWKLPKIYSTPSMLFYKCTALKTIYLRNSDDHTKQIITNARPNTSVQIITE